MSAEIRFAFKVKLERRSGDGLAMNDEEKAELGIILYLGFKQQCGSSPGIRATSGLKG